MKTYTKGPWKLDVNNTNGYTTDIRTDDECGWLLAMVHEQNGESLSNARLIAAAPEMFETLNSAKIALTKLRQGNRDGGTMEECSIVLDMILDVIRKANGENI